MLFALDGGHRLPHHRFWASKLHPCAVLGGEQAVSARWLGLAITTRIAYVGLLVGPLLIGPIAELVGLRLSLLSLLLAIVTMTIGWLLLSRTSSGTPWHIASDHSPRVPARTREPTSTP